MRAMLSISLVAVCLVGCGGSDDNPADAPPGGIDSATPAATCATYCSTIGTNCTGNNQQFESMATCAASCATWLAGTPGMMAGNSLECRAYHAGAAGADPATHCRHAGPGGDAACGMNCEGFCTLVQGVCTGADEAFADEAACMAACGGFPTTPPYSSNVQTGDSFACRLYHATAASTTPDPHCTHVNNLGPCNP